jgi:HlyD family secretion protein
MKKHSSKITYGIGGFAVLAAIAFTAMFLTPTQKKHYITAPAAKMNLTETISATGNVAAEEEATLAFDQQAGTVALVKVAVGDQVKKGDILGSLSNDILRANLEAAKADEFAAETSLALDTQKVSDASTTLISTMHDAYLKVESAILSKTDAFFTSAISINPTTILPTGSMPIQNMLNSERVTMGQKLSAWKANVDSQTFANDTISFAKQFLNDIATITNTMTINSSGLQQSQIDTDRSIVNAALTQVTAAESEYTGARAALNQATGQGQAQVQKALAQIEAIQSQIRHTMIVAPFDGIITRVEPKVGEVFAAGVPAFGIMSNGVYKIELQVPETDIAKVSIGNNAQVTLDAYGSGVTFPATVTSVDPAETVVNGIHTYKITLHFTDTDARIRSGMTANVQIVTKEVTDAVAIPSRAIITRGKDTFTLVKDSSTGEFKETKINVGIKSADGFSEIISGISAGDSVASFGN